MILQHYKEKVWYMQKLKKSMVEEKIRLLDNKSKMRRKKEVTTRPHKIGCYIKWHLSHYITMDSTIWYSKKLKLVTCMYNIQNMSLQTIFTRYNKIQVTKWYYTKGNNHPNKL